MFELSANTVAALSPREHRHLAPSSFSATFVMLTQRPTPAFMSQEAARRLPRFALALLLAVFILSSFWADGLWTLRDAAGFGVAQSMTNGGLEAWLLPQIQGTPEAEIGPLAGWAAALFMKLFSELLGEIGAYRLTSVFWFLFTSVAVWSTAWRLARRAEAQPVAFAFGGQAAPVSFARTTASCAVLFFVASFGIATRQYEPIADTALVAAAAWALYGAAWALRRPFVGAFVSGLAAGGAALTTSFACGFWLFLSALAAQAVLRALGGSRLLRISFTVLGFAAPLIFWIGTACLTVPDAAEVWFPLWFSNQAQHLEPASAAAIFWLSRTAVWFLLPMWPIALWALYSWRRQLDRTQILLPSLFLAAIVFAGFFIRYDAAGNLLLISIAPTCVLAAFGLASLRRSRENLLDWFALSVFTVALLTVWLYWLAALTGMAPKMAKSVYMLAPGLDVTLDWSILAPLTVTVIWFVFVIWRLTHRPIVVWRGPWLSAAGMTAVAVTLLGLWHEGIDVNRSYQGVARATAEAIESLAGTGTKIDGADLPGGIRAALHYYGGIDFARPGEKAPLKLVRVRSDYAPAKALTEAISRPHTDETFYLVAGTIR